MIIVVEFVVLLLELCLWVTSVQTAFLCPGLKNKCCWLPIRTQRKLTSIGVNDS